MITMHDAIPLEKFIGQEVLIRMLQAEAKASKITNRPLPHAIFAGPPGLGKDTLIKSLAQARGVNIVKYMGSQFKEESVIQAALCANADGHDKKGFVVDRTKVCPSIIWIDECEQVPLPIFEILHAILEPQSDGRRLFHGKVPRKTERVLSWFPEASFCLSTNYLGHLRKRGAAIMNRIPIKWMFEPYSMVDLVKIIHLRATELNVAIDKKAAAEISNRSLGIPRTANLLLDRCITAMINKTNHAPQKGDLITQELAQQALSALGIDDIGLAPAARTYLVSLSKEPGGKMGIDSLSSIVGLDKETVMIDIEPFLVKQGLVRVIPGGREITEKGLHHIGDPAGSAMSRRIFDNTTV